MDKEEVKIIRITPDQLGYQDRGIMKWMGMILSDHTEALKKERIKSKSLEVKPKEKMTAEKISTILLNAHIANYPVLIQANVINNQSGNHYKDLACKVMGYVDEQIYLTLKDERVVTCTLEQIRNVEWMDLSDWYAK